MRIIESARDHGVADEDMLHVVETALAIFPITASQGDRGEMYIGLNRAQNAVLEVLVVDGDTTDARIIHAHKARKHYLKKLP